MTENKHASEETLEDTAVRVDADTATEATTDDGGSSTPPPMSPKRSTRPTPPSPPSRNGKMDWSRIVAFAVLPALALALALGAAFLKFVDSGVRDSETARDQSVQAAKDSTVALLSYKPDTVEQQLTAARDRLTGSFRDQYTDLTNNVVIPGAKQKQISAVASVPEVASVSANPGHAVVLVFVNQTVTVGNDVPTDTASSVRVTLDKVGDRWLISQFEPV